MRYIDGLGLRAPDTVVHIWKHVLLICTGIALSISGCGPGQNSDIPPDSAILGSGAVMPVDGNSTSGEEAGVAAAIDPVTSDRSFDQAPGSLRITSPKRGLIMLAWEDRSSIESSYVVMRSTDATNWSNYAQLPANSTSYSDTHVRDGLRYYYKIGRGSGENAKYSNMAGTTAKWNTACLVRCPSSRPGRAFPSAEGFGAMTRGGRGGATVFVTSLADYNSRELGEPVIPGTLRWAVEALTGPRTVLFRVGGTIEAKTSIDPREENGSFLTIAGQSAPGEGIQLKGHGIRVFNAHDVIIRYLRIRPGYTSDADWDKDAVTVWGAYGGVCRNVIVDHCSLEWAIDENGNVWDAAENITLQHCIFGEGSTFGHHGHDAEGAPPGYSHSMGLLIGGDGGFASDTYVSVHHNLFIQNLNRNPLMCQVGGLAEFINNIVYNWGSYGCSVHNSETGHSSPRANIVGNLFQRGPAYVVGYDRHAVDVNDLDNNSLYVRDNLGPFRPNAGDEDWDIVGESNVDPSAYVAGAARQRRSTHWPAAGIPITTSPAGSLMASLPNNVGCVFPNYDSVDAGLMADLLTGTGSLGFGSSPANAEAFPIIANGPSPADSDSDGIPDGWELSQGLDPRSSSDAQQDPDGDGYTNLEEYLNDIVQED